MPPTPAVDLSPYRDEIITKLLEGVSPRRVEQWLVDKYGEEYKISHTSLNNYKKNKIDIVGKAKKKVQQREKKAVKEKVKAIEKEPETDAKIEKVVSNVADGIEFLQDHINEAKDIELNPNVSLDLDKETALDREKYKLNIKKSAVQSVKVLNEIYKDEPEPPKVNVFVNQIAKNKEDLDKSRSFLDSVDPNNS